VNRILVLRGKNESWSDRMLDEHNIDQSKRLLVAEFLSDTHLPKYVLGRNKCAAQLSKFVEIDAYIDDFTEEKVFLGKPILKSGDIQKNGIVVSSSLAIYPHSAMHSLEKAGIAKRLHFLDLCKYGKDSQLSMPFIDLAIDDIELNYSHYELLYEKLSDEVSKTILLDLLNFRKNRDISYLSAYHVDFEGQYFEDFLSLSDNEVFVDVGSFDGNTSIQFIKHCPGYKSVYIFEPSATNLIKTKKNLREYQNIHFKPLGLSDLKALLQFDAEAGSASAISVNGKDTIEVDRLDDVLKERVTFIKMDIEGAEAQAIKGMSMHILNDHPKLAISVYHKPDDIWKIPNQILAIRNDYNIYIRHYTEGTDETVMFFIPPSN
jgi:FkbM family methyltransferase